jgi:alanine racemase
LNSHHVWAEISLKAIENNIVQLRGITAKHVRFMAVVKANAYGHGIIEVAKCVADSGADALGVAKINEAMCLRQAGLDLPILIFGFTPLSFAKHLVANDLTQTVYSYEMAEALSAAAVFLGKKIRVHVKVDTGMGRLGLLSDCFRTLDTLSEKKNDIVHEIESIDKLHGLEIEGIFTHFATADSKDKTYANRQFEIFKDILDQLHFHGLDIPVKHAANSAAIIDMPETHLDMVRCGILAYGLYPSPDVNHHRISIEPAMTLKTSIIHIKKVKLGFKISYGAEFETRRSTVIATVPVGYSDGLNRLLSSRGHMLVSGKKVNIVGRVCMDLTMLDVGDDLNVACEDEVVIIGRQGKTMITADDIASLTSTINYEVLTSIPGHIHRCYLK